MASRYYSAIAQDTTLSSSITNTSTSMVVGATVGYPATPFVLAVDFNAASEELVLVTNISGTTLSITRGYNGTTAVAHNTGATVRHVITAQDLTDAQNHYSTALSAGAHGVTGALATFLGSPTSSNLAAVVTDETGSGNLVFSTGPTISGPVLTGTVTAGGTTGASGQFLSSTGTGVAWATAASGVSTLDLSFNAQTGTTYTLVSGDTNKLVTANNASAITITIPPSVFTAGNQIHVQQIGAGQVTFAAGAGVTITSTGTTSASPKLRAQYSASTIICTGTNTFTVLGDIA